MPTFDSPIPLALYIHFPWCIKKCPYCDFNSHALSGSLPEDEYVNALLLNVEDALPSVWGRSVISIFMGGGTPSLFSADALEKLMQGLKARIRFAGDIEITLEANPGAVEQARFKQYRELGINRISLGIQSFNNKHLKLLGRVHDAHEALQAIATVKQAGFSNFNIDLMFGLPEQNIQEGLLDLQTAIDQNPTHLSWYELTLEPNTYFWHHPPVLPQDDDIIDLQLKGQILLAQNHYQQYEVSAYSRNRPCQHNLNYWEFGDYLAIGAGSHAKITDIAKQQVNRYHHHRHPKHYMEHREGFVKETQYIQDNQLAFEFMLNALRLKSGVPTTYFAERTGLSLDFIQKSLEIALQKKWIMPYDQNIRTTPLGYQFLNDVVSLFLPEEQPA